MKVDKDFKHEFDQDFADASYGLRKILGKIVMWVLILSIIGGIFGAGFRYFRVNADREIFKQSITYNEGMLDDLAKYKYEYDTADSDNARDGIAALVRQRFANFDKSKIENRDLRLFLEDCGV